MDAENPAPATIRMRHTNPLFASRHISRALIAVSVAILSCQSLAHAAAIAAAVHDASDDDQDAPKDPRIDFETGRQLGVWPLDRPFDHIAMRLELDFPDMSKANLTGVETITLAAIGVPRTIVPLDCVGPVVKSVTADGAKPCTFTQEHGKLLITLPQPAQPDKPITVVIAYDLDFSKNRGEGLTYSKANPEADGLTRQSPQIHAQGEAQCNSQWFPCHDFPNDKLTSQIIVNIEEGYEVVSNGHLVSRSAAGTGPDGKPRERWDWLQDKPHSPYLVTVAIGKFAVLEFGGPQSARPGIPIPVYTPFGTEEAVQKLYASTPEMIAYFEETFDEPYPWDKYAQCLVRDFAAGGMENTSCTLMTLGSTRGEAGSQDDLISHELAHQWFGDLVTCKTWAHIWLNEGWASYAEALWNEHKGAKITEEKARTGYQKTVRGFFQSQRFRNKSTWPQYTPLVSNRYRKADNLFTRPEDPYAKGAMLLHMLRQRIGDAAFFKGTQAYLDHYKFGVAETDDFRREMEASSGQSLERFFDQWAFRPGLPRLAIELEWNDATSSLAVGIKQTQPINGMNPAFAFSLPIRFKFEDGSFQSVSLDIDATETSASFKLPSKPSQVSVDPGMTIIAPSTITKELAWWMDELRDGPTYASRIAAAEALADSLAAIENAAVRAALAAAAADDSLDSTIRLTASNALTDHLAAKTP